MEELLRQLGIDAEPVKGENGSYNIQFNFWSGHLFNLLNGSGMKLVANLCQVVGAVSVGFLFVLILLRGGSIIPCIATHAAIDMVSLFANEDGLTTEKRILFGVVRIAIVILYICVITGRKNGGEIHYEGRH